MHLSSPIVKNIRALLDVTDGPFIPASFSHSDQTDDYEKVEGGHQCKSTLSTCDEAVSQFPSTGTQTYTEGGPLLSCCILSVTVKHPLIHFSEFTKITY